MEDGELFLAKTQRFCVVFTHKEYISGTMHFLSVNVCPFICTVV